MVFGLGRKKEAPQKAEEPAGRDITIGDIEGILRELIGARAGTLIGEAAAFRDAAAARMGEVGRIAVELEGDDLKVDDIDPNLKTIVMRGKRQVISTIKEESAREMSGAKTVEDVVALNDQLGRSLRRMGDALGRQSRVIHIFAKKYAGKLKTILSELKDGQEEIQGLVDAYRGLEEAAAQMRHDIGEIAQSEKMLVQKSARLSSLEESAAGLDDEADQLAKRIADIKKSDEYAGLLRIRERLAEIESERRALRREINDRFTRVSRPLGKYEYVSSLDRDQKELLHGMVSDPFAAISGKRRDDVMTILQHAKKGVVSGSVSVKDADKAVQSLDDTSETLDSMIRQKEELVEREGALRAEMDAADTGKYEGAVAELERIRFDRSETGAKIRQIGSEIDEGRERMAGLASSVESALRTTSSTKYTIRAES